MGKITLSAFLLASVFANAQDQLTNSGNFQLFAGANVTLLGNFSNNGSLVDSGQAITFKGTSSQNISGTSVSAFNHLIINNSSGVTLQQNANVTSSLVLTTGGLTLNSKTLTINNSSPTAVSRTNGYTVSEQTDNSGKTIWNIQNTTGPHIFPFGTASGNYIPFTLDLTAGNIGNVTVSTYPTASNNTPYPSAPIVVTNMNDAFENDNSANMVDRFWQIDKDGASGTATLQFTATSAEVGTITSLQAQRWSNGWQQPLPEQSRTATTATVPNVSTFSPWTLSGNITPLPIGLLKFDANLNSSKTVDIIWSTASERNNDYFTIEKSVDAINFSSIAIMKGAGNSTSTLHYADVDMNPYQGISYYRLKQTDFDGNPIYSQTASINNSNALSSSLNIFPNPGNGNTFNLMFAGNENDKMMIDIYDSEGQKVYSGIIYNSNAKESNVINPSEKLASGVYMVVATSANEIITKQFIVKQQ